MKTKEQNRTHRIKLTEVQLSEFLTDESTIYNREKTMASTNSTGKTGYLHAEDRKYIVISHSMKSNSKRSNDFTLIKFFDSTGA
jgi:predicted GNAT family acetyltransferase